MSDTPNPNNQESESKECPKLWTFFEDNNGGFSSMRLAFLSLIFAVIFGWVYVTYQTKTIPSLPDSIITLVLGVAGTKMVQRFGEKTE